MFERTTRRVRDDAQQKAGSYFGTPHIPGDKPRAASLTKAAQAPPDVSSAVLARQRRAAQYPSTFWFYWSICLPPPV